MRSEIKKRKKRFWAFCLAFVLVLVQAVPSSVLATDYTLNDESKLEDGAGNKLTTGNIMHEGDKITFKTATNYYTSVTISCYDTDDSKITSLSETINIGNTATQTVDRTVPAYPDSTKSEAFKGWEITSIYGSSGYLSSIALKAVFYTESSITYNLDGGVHDSETPVTSYYEGKEEITLGGATKTGYTFDGWYKGSADSSEKVEKILTTDTGTITLYAKFTPNTYGIEYELNGGTNAAGNPLSYTYGTGVASFADATKIGYSFDGWYSNEALTTPISSISATQTETVKLYAKFTPNTYGIEYKLDGGTNAASNPSSYICGTGVASFADATKTGYTFDGWYSDADFTTKVTSISTIQTENIILYAKFLVNDYSITYNLDGGTNGEGNPSGYVYGVGVGSFAEATKTNYTFDGWYSDAAFTTKVTSISATQTGNVTLYARFIGNTYGISYELNGGTNGAGNPSSYTYGTGVASFADATKTGYTFEGWYSDATFTTKVTSIPTTQTGDATLYAKFTKIVKEGTGTVVVDDVYYGEAINPVLTSATNGTDHVTIEYKKKGEADSTYTTTAPVKAGKYTVRATFAKTEDYYEVIATDDFSILKKEGEGSVKVADVYYGKTPKPVVVSKTNGTKNVKIEYKEKDASDDKYTTVKPTKVGAYTVKATFAATEEYLKVTATADFSIAYLETPESSYKLEGTKGENDYYISAVTIIPAKGYDIATSLDGKYEEKLEVTESSDAFSVYLKNVKTGEKTSAIEIPELKIDQDKPVISNAVDGQMIYADQTEIIVKDDNLSQVLVNNNSVEFKDGMVVLQLSSNQGEESYEIVGVDEAGNRSEISIVVAAEWMKTGLIPLGEIVRLTSGNAYQLGSGSWKVSGDATTYAGNATFYVNRDGEYSFTNAD